MKIIFRFSYNNKQLEEIFSIKLIVKLEVLYSKTSEFYNRD